MSMRYLSLAVVVVVLLLAASTGCSLESSSSEAGPPFSGPESFRTDVTSGKVASVDAATADQTLSVKLTDGTSYMVPYLDLATVDQMLAAQPDVNYTVDGKVRQ